MARHCSLISIEDSVNAGPSAPLQSVNWSICVLCQESKTEKLICPDQSNSKVKGAGYNSLAEALKRFHAIHKLPPNIQLECLDEGGGLEETLIKHNARWHKTCRNRLSTLKLERLKRKADELQEHDSDSDEVISKCTRSVVSTDTGTAVCFFCDKEDINLHNAETYDIDTHVREAALLLHDSKLLGKLSVGDMMAIEAKYHSQCLTSFYNRKRSYLRQTAWQSNSHSAAAHSITLAQLVSYINETHLDQTIAPVFKLSDLVQLYNDRLCAFGVNETVHPTRLKDKLLVHVPGLTAHKQGRQVLLAFDEDIGLALADACEQTSDADGFCLAKCAEIIRRNIFDEQSNFTGHFQHDCQKDSVPASLLALVQMILEGPNIKNQSQELSAQAALSVSQIIKFNSIKHKRKPGTTIHHNRNQETPLPLYLGMMIHAQTRKKGLVDKLFDLGLCVSYDRVLRLSSDLSSSVCEHFQQIGTVCPPGLLKQVFTTAVVDNIDHNPSSTTSSGSFHGTGISLIQHPSAGKCGTPQTDIVLRHSATKTIAPLPGFYTNIIPVTKGKDPPVPFAPVDISADNPTINSVVSDEYEWCKTVSDNINEEATQNNITWSAYHAELQTKPVKHKCTSALLPLFPDVAHSETMIRHTMDVVKAAVAYLNPGQVPVLACDQLLFTLAKQIQWTWPQSYGEDQIVIMFGGLHVEMAGLKTVGTWLEGSGWSNALVQADVASPGIAESFIHASHVTRTRYAHQVTAASLYTLQQQAYQLYIESAPDELMSFSTWCADRCKNCPTFQYWSLALELEVIILTFVRALRESNFRLYIDSLKLLTPWFFALDKTNYSRWMPVHIRDMENLSTKHSSVADAFSAGHFTVQKTSHVFSAMALDQAHEQNNEMVKGYGWVIGLTENAQALRRWMIAGPEVSRMVNSFEENLPKKETSEKHHDQNAAAQDRFQKHVQDLIATIDEFGNPFTEKSEDLIGLCSRDIMDPSAVKTVKEVKTLGETQYKTYITERLVDKSKPLSDALKRNNLPLFKVKTVRTRSSDKLKLAAAKTDCKLFARLYIACQHRDGDLTAFFAHENQAWPPSLSDNVTIRLGTKSDLLTCLNALGEVMTETPPVTAIVFDAAALVQMLKPRGSKTFAQYSSDIFIPYLHSQLQSRERGDVVWDSYRSNSLKASTREKRGKGQRRRVQANTTIPKNWQDFLRVSENKMELFSFLSHQVVHNPLLGKNIIATDGQSVLCVPLQDVSQLAPCSHEEADTRLILHVSDLVKKGHKKIIIRTVDTDVVTLAVASCVKLQITEFWIVFGTGRNFRYLPIHQYAKALGPDKSEALPAFHAFTGCDTVSCFLGRGKKSAWDVWTSYPAVTEAFLELVRCPQHISDKCLELLERFVVLLYDRSSTMVKVNDARKHLFTKRNRSIDNLPPSHAALGQHVRRTAYQAGHIWGQAMDCLPTEPVPSDWGWTLNGEIFSPMWTTLSEAASSCYELLHCECKTGCINRRCKCVRADLSCTSLCSCDGECHRE